MILKDFQCRICGTIQECTVDVNENTVHLFCNQCDSEMQHDSLCNGGLNSRYRFADLSNDPRDYRGQVKCSPSNVRDCETDSPVMHKDGGNIEKKITDEKRLLRRDKLYFNNDKKRGKTPLWFYK